MDRMSKNIVWSLCLLTTACADSKGVADPIGAVERAPLAAFPTAELLDETGHLAIPEDLLPQGETPFPVERLRWRTGFSPVQTTVIDPEVALDAQSLPPPVGTGAADSVVIWDLTANQQIRCLAELDAFPDNPEVPRLLVRPMQPLPVGHRIAISASRAVTTAEGTPWSGPAWFADAAAGAAVNDGPTGHYSALVDDLVAAGLPEPVVAVDFVVGDGTHPLTSMVAELPTPTEWGWTQVYNTDLGDELAEGTWIIAEGWFRTQNWLVDDQMFDLDADGTPIAHDTVDAELYVLIPDTVRAADIGTAPVWVFGHGIFARPENYLATSGDESGVVAIARAAGAIVVATTWRGLTTHDLLTAVEVGGDMGRIPALTDKLAQGIANTAAMSRLLAYGDLLDDPLFAGRADPSTLRYYGISLGGIQGATLLSVDETIPYGVFHVGGGSWSTMLERSSNWTQFESVLKPAVPSPSDRQILYAASQLFWDTADPALRTDILARRAVLWQGSIGDEQVSNITTGLLAEAAGATILAPNTYNQVTMAALPVETGPIAGPALVWYDPEVGAPPLNNRPAAVSGAHDIPRRWPGQHAQTLRFLDTQDPGAVEHFCGASPCSASNPGVSE